MSLRSASNGPIERLNVASVPPRALGADVGEDEQEVAVDAFADVGRLRVADRRVHRSSRVESTPATCARCASSGW